MMNPDWMIDISVDGKSESEQICLCSGDSGAHLNHCDESDAIVYTGKDEIFIERVGEVPVEIERYGRKRLICTDHPTRILANDTIRVGSAKYRVRGIFRLNQPQRTPSFFNLFAKQVFLTSAAAIILAVIPACKPSEPPNQALTESPKCENGDVKLMMCLNNNRYEKCNDDDRWELVEECKIPSNCKYVWQGIYNETYMETTTCDNFSSEPCKNGTYVCLTNKTRCEQSPSFDCWGDDEIYKCEDNKWKLQEKCASDQECKITEGFMRVEAKCVVAARFTTGAIATVDCETGNLKCDSGNAVMECHGGLWYNKEICKKNDICKTISPTNAVCVSPDLVDVNNVESELPGSVDDDNNDVGNE